MNFLFPLLLIGAVLALIPLILQIFQRLRKKKILFPAIFLFKEEMLEANQSIKLKNNILLLLRVLLVLLIVIIMAKPMTNKEFRFLEDEKTRENILLILLDNTKSMGFISQDKTLFQRALNQLKMYIRELPLQNPVVIEELATDPSYPIKLLDSKEKIINRLRFIHLGSAKIPFAKRVKQLCKEIEKERLLSKALKLLFQQMNQHKEEWIIKLTARAEQNGKNSKIHSIISQLVQHSSASKSFFESLFDATIKDDLFSDTLELLYETLKMSDLITKVHETLSKIDSGNNKKPVLSRNDQIELLNEMKAKNWVLKRFKKLIYEMAKEKNIKKVMEVMAHTTKERSLKEIIVFSDFQKSEWKGIHFPPSIRLTLIKLGETHPANLGIVKVHTDQDIQLAYQGGDLKVNIKNYGSQSADGTISIFLGGQLKHEKQIALEPDEEKSVQFNVVSQTDQRAFGEVRLTNIRDEYNEDNHHDFSIYIKKKVNILLLKHRDFPIANNSLMWSIQSTYRKALSNIRFHNKIGMINKYDFIITNRVTQLRKEEVRLIRSHIEQGIPVFIILNQRDEAFRVRSILEKLGLSGGINVVKRMRFKSRQTMVVSDKLNSEHDFYKLFVMDQSHRNREATISWKVTLKSIFNVRFNNNQYDSLLKAGRQDLLIQSSVRSRNIFLWTAGINGLNSNFMNNLWYPLIINWIFQEGLRKYLRHQGDIVPELRKSYTKESNLLAYSRDELESMYQNMGLSSLNLPVDTKKWLQSEVMTHLDYKSQSNGLLEKLFFIIIVLIFFLELIFSYPISVKGWLKKALTKT
ncbi:MAG: hypothetical protein IEMM0008_0250 [bacterium]|nr:MAG: hypothetical protein IEMM0008_0250 [bacterium]